MQLMTEDMVSKVKIDVWAKNKIKIVKENLCVISLPPNRIQSDL